MSFVIIRNKKHGTEERVTEEEAKRLQDGPYARAFEFIPVPDPPEAKEAIRKDAKAEGKK